MASNYHKILPILAISLMLFLSACIDGGEVTEDVTDTINDTTDITNGVPPITGGRFLTILATSPHTADMADISAVNIHVFDENGNPITGADVTLILSGGEDFFRSYPVSEIGNGEYRGYVTWPYSGTYHIQATDEASKASAETTIEFLPGPAADIRMSVSNPRLSHRGDTSSIEAWIIDKHGNIVPDVSIAMTSDFGSLTRPVRGSDGIFKASLSSTGLGNASITAHYTSSATGGTFEDDVIEGESVIVGGYNVTLKGVGVDGVTDIDISDGITTDSHTIREYERAEFFGGAVSVNVTSILYGTASGSIATLKIISEETSTTLFTQTAQIDFPMFFVSADHYAIYGETYSATLYLYVPDSKKVGYYAIKMPFSSRALEVEDVRFPSTLRYPNHSLASNYVYFEESFNQSTRPANQVIEIATVDFAVIRAGDIGIDATLYADTPASLLDEGEEPVAPEFEGEAIIGDGITIPVAIVKAKKPICIKVWDVNDSITEADFQKDFNQMKEIFKKLVGKSCPNFDFTYRWNDLSGDDWTNITGGDGKLNANYVGEPEVTKLFAHRLADCINVYYIPDFESTTRTGNTISPKLTPDANKQGVMVKKGLSNNRTLAHEIGHFFWLGHDEYEKDASGDVVEKKNAITGESLKWTNSSNLMYPYKNTEKFDLTELQCEWVTQKDP